MKITAAQLNAAAELLGTTDKNVVIAAVMKTLVDGQVGSDEAFELIFGEGSFARFAGQVHAALLAKK